MTRPTTPAQWLPWIGTALAVLSFAWTVVEGVVDAVVKLNASREDI